MFSLLHYINLFISKRKNYNGNEYKQYTGKDVIEENRKVVLTENSLDKAIDKAREAGLVTYIYRFIQPNRRQRRIIKRYKQSIYTYLTAQKYIETIDSTTVGEAETHINELGLFCGKSLIDITFGVDMTLR